MSTKARAGRFDRPRSRPPPGAYAQPCHISGICYCRAAESGLVALSLTGALANARALSVRRFPSLIVFGRSRRFETIAGSRGDMPQHHRCVMLNVLRFVACVVLVIIYSPPNASAEACSDELAARARNLVYIARPVSVRARDLFDKLKAGNCSVVSELRALNTRALALCEQYNREFSAACGPCTVLITSADIESAASVCGSGFQRQAKPRGCPNAAVSYINVLPKGQSGYVIRNSCKEHSIRVTYSAVDAGTNCALSKEAPVVVPAGDYIPDFSVCNIPPRIEGADFQN